MRKAIIFFCFVLNSLAAFSNAGIKLPKVTLSPTKSIKNILGEFQNTGNRLIGNAQSAGNSVAARFGNELSVAVQNLTYYFGEDLKATLGSLKVEERNLFNLLNNFIDKFNHFDQTLYRISELVNLDLIDLTNRLPLTRKVEYFISSVNGSILINSDDADYKMTITGIGFGLSNGKTKYDTKIYIDSILLSINDLDFTQRRQIIVSIPNNLVKVSFKNKNIAFIPVKIVNEIKKPGGLFKSKKVVPYETNFKLTLMPVVAGKVTITEILTEKKITSNPSSHLWSRTFADKQCQTSAPLNTKIKT